MSETIINTRRQRGPKVLPASVTIIPSAQSFSISSDLVEKIFTTEGVGKHKRRESPLFELSIDAKKKTATFQWHGDQSQPGLLRGWFTPHCMRIAARGALSALEIDPTKSTGTYKASAGAGWVTLHLGKRIGPAGK